MLLSATAACIIGCRRPDTDVSSSNYYNFSSFTNTAWKTKGKVALADMEEYTGRHVLSLVGPQVFDKTHPQYVRQLNQRVITVLPFGTHLRIGRLMEDNGEWGGVRATAILDDGRQVEIDRTLLAKNRFLYDNLTSPSTNWGVDPDLL